MRIQFILAIILCAWPMAAQDNTMAPVFPKPDYFKKVFSKENTKVELQPPVRLPDFVQGGKLELSLRNYLDLVLANNTDIQVSKLSIQTFRDDITRQYSVFDPLVQARFSSTRTNQPANDALAGAATLNQLNQPFSFSYSQVLQTGTQVVGGFSASKLSTNSSFATFNPALNSNLNFSLAQPLLKNRGGYITRLPITIARSRLRSNEYTTLDTLMKLVVGAENAYWDVVFARENLQVQEQALSLADQLLKRSKRELELGAISPLDIFQPEANFATAQLAVSQARFRLNQAEDAMRKQIGADLDPAVRNLPIALTETVDIDLSAAAIDKDEAVAKAMRLRPDLKSVNENLALDDLSLRVAKNALLPDLSLTGQYQSTGRGGPFFYRQNIFAGDGTSSTVVSTIPGGFSDALSQMFGFGFPVYGGGLTLRLPIRDRRAAADYADAVVNKRLDTLRRRSLEQQTRLDVLNAISQLDQSRASIDLAKVALDLAQKRVDAEHKKYDLGTTTIFFVASAEQDLTTARSTLVTNMIQYRRNRLNLLQRTGELLQERGITLQ